MLHALRKVELNIEIAMKLFHPPTTSVERKASLQYLTKDVFSLEQLNNYEFGELLHVESVVTMVVNLTSAIIAISGNGIILLTFWKSNQLWSQSQLFIWCLAFADFLTALMVQPFYGAYKIAYMVGHFSASCVLRVIFETFGWFSAVLSCSLVSSILGERYLALHYHMRYHDLMTTKKIALYIAYLLVVTVILSLSRFATTNVAPFLYINVCGLLLSLLTLVVCYWKIYKVVRRHFQEIRDHNSTGESGQAAIDMQRFKKWVINMAYVTVLYMISYIPFTCVLFAYLCCGLTVNVEAAYDITRTMAFMNSSWNPFLYFWKIHELRETVKKVLKRGDPSTLIESRTINHSLWNLISFLFGQRNEFTKVINNID